MIDMQAEYNRLDALRDAYASKGYSNHKCKFCGRQRVLLCSNGKRICEKCHYDQDVGEFSEEYSEVYS